MFKKIKGAILLLVLILFLANCTTVMRYSYEEIKNFPPEVQEQIIKGDVMTGMTPLQVRYAWGHPNKIEVLVPENNKYKEEWIYYSNLGILKTRLIFIDHKLTYVISSTGGKVNQ